MSKNIESFKEGVLRTPLLTFEQLKDLNRDKIIEIASNKEFQEAISISSHDFYKKMISWLEVGSKDEKDEKSIYATLYKYIARSASRPTPFGKFGSVSHFLMAAEVKEGEKFEIVDQQKVHYKIDGRLLDKLINKLEKGKLAFSLSYFLNDTIYSAGDEMRYYEQKTNIQDIYYQLSKFENNELVAEIIDVFKTGAKLEDVFPIGKKHDIPQADLTAFLLELASEKILISELKFVFSSATNLHYFIEKIEFSSSDLQQNDKEYLEMISGLKKIYHSLEHDESHVIILNTISNVSESLDIHHNIQDLIHVDTSRLSKNQLVVEQSLQDELLEAQYVLQKLQQPVTSPLTQFKEALHKRYEYRAVSLLKVLDPEVGIGFPYEDASKDSESLIASIKFPIIRRPDQDVSLSKAETLLLKKVIESDRTKLDAIDLTIDDVKDLRANQSTNSFNAFFTLLDNSIQLNCFSGHSSTQLISRFANLNSDIDKLCLKISQLEEKLDPGKILAEVVHVPELKSANLIQEKNYRSFEIPCLSKSNNTEVESIPLSDIYLRIKSDNTLELISKKHKKVIIPKLSNSLNYKRNSIPLFNFLCSMQSQNKASYLSFDWNNVSNLFDHLPRVNFKRIILSPELWKVSISEFTSKEPSYDELCEWREKRKIHKYVYIARSTADDNRLFIDFTNKIALSVFFKELSSNKNMILFESISDSCSKQISNHENNFYTNEVLLPCFQKQVTPPPNYNYDLILSEDKTNIFLPGEEWFSFKMYTGFKTANELLINQFSTIVEGLLAKGIVKKWFFVRYYDDAFHIRFRFLVENKEQIPLVYSEMLPLLSQYTRSDLIHNIVIDSYKRENDRYNAVYIEDIESLFSYDSTAVVDYYKLNDPKTTTWEFAAMGIDHLLNDFEIDYEFRKSLLSNLYDGFFKEFAGNQELKKSLDKKYREIKSRLFSLLSPNDESLNMELVSIFHERSIKNKKSVKNLLESGFQEQLEGTYSGVLSSVIHMFMNKLFLAQNRRNELIIYYFLFQFYKSKYAILSQPKQLIHG